MKSEVGVAPMLALLVVAAASSIVLAAECDPGEPCADDVTVIGYETAPGGVCQGPVYDAAILASNASSEYTYRVDVTARGENDSSGNTRCGISPPDCTGQSCEVNLSDSEMVVNTNDDAVFKHGDALPTCQPCSQHCDNEAPCPPASHCTCVVGVYRVTHWSDNEGLTYTAMAPGFKIAITEKERDAICPNPGPACDTP